MRNAAKVSFILFVILVSAITLQAAPSNSSAKPPSRFDEQTQPCSAVVPRVTAELNEQLLTTLTGNVHPLARLEYDRGRVSDSLPMEHIILVLRRSPDRQEHDYLQRHGRAGAQRIQDRDPQLECER